MMDWVKAVDDYITRYSGEEEKTAHANAEMVKRVVRGQGPDKDAIDESSGARAVVNLAAVHVPAFCESPASSKPYKNAYDLKTAARLGSIPAGTPIPLRSIVDEVIEEVTKIAPENLYFAAVEINGTGIRFYGDVCFVLKAAEIPDETVVLDRNSYDLVRPPTTPRGSAPDRGKMIKDLEHMTCQWGGADLSLMSVVKVFDSRPFHKRRLTTGQVSAAVLDDEDYLEVLKVGSFSAKDLQEARVSAPDTAAETKILERLRLGPCPSLAELHWRKHRVAAARALHAVGVQTRVVTGAGRVRA
jgi:hypothetical protein